ncbi:hypothetical protein C7382_10356 [Porphyromonas loveana]|uniref:Uncharacterized protein n=1 Tax=Porphyromonas loveana TaxID=1884669 RepID=A0A2U1FME8_9PORP|nr:hypothetical protein C7382_10356 [Porphyromonas loveana]
MQDVEYANELKSTFSEGIEIGYFSLRLSFASFLWVAYSFKDKEKKPREIFSSPWLFRYLIYLKRLCKRAVNKWQRL